MAPTRRERWNRSDGVPASNQPRRADGGALWRRLILWGASLRLIVAAIVAALALSAQSAAQVPIFPGGGGDDAPTSVEQPALDSPEAVDAALARLTDAEIRVLLRDELARKAEAAAADVEAAGPMGLAALRERMVVLIDTVRTRAAQWATALASLDDRAEAVDKRLAMASHGVLGMVSAALLILIGAIAAAWLTIRLTAGWSAWLRRCSGESYWDRLVRTGALVLVELAPIAVFALVLTALAPLFRGLLGPIMASDISYLWIFEAGVANGWAIIVLSRRAFAPDAPQLRIANVTDAAAIKLHERVRISTFIGLGGWLIAGLFPTFGYGFPPALTTVALAGAAVYAALIISIAMNFQNVSQASARLIGVGSDVAGAFDAEAQRGAPASRVILRAIAPWLVIGYATFAFLFWLAHWITTGQQQLAGPLGTFFVLLTVPAFDRLGQELVRTAMSRSSEAAQRFREVLLGAWRVLLLLVASWVIALLWGVDFLSFAKGEGAAPWASAAFDIAVALLVGQLIWRLIQAALHRERRVAGADEDADIEVGAVSRLDTLVPLLRNILLLVLAIIVVMIVLSSLGVDIGPLLASAGIIGIAIGFGAQTLVRDIFSGAFFLIDDAFRVGEYIELEGDLRGEVEAISVRSLQLRHHRGAVVTIPFGELKNVTNHSRDWVIYKMSFRLEPDTDPAQVKKIVKRVGFELMEDPEHGPKFLQPLKSQGVFMIDDDSALVIRVKFMSKPRMQFVLRREVYHRLRAAFAENDVRFARRKVEVVSSSDNPDDVARAASAAADTQPQPGVGGLATTADQR